MKKLVLLTVLLGAMPITMMAQDDDLYFVPTKENVAKEAEKYGMPTNTYYAGSTRSADEYNRRAWSRVAPIDSAGNDIIDFSAEKGVYPDSAFSEVNDYKYTSRMSRFDDYTPSAAYWAGYRDGRWMSPWYYNSYYSWYDPWYSPWYYGGYYGYYSWYDPWYSPYYYSSWYSPYYYRYGYWGGYYGPRYYSYGSGGRSWSRVRISHHKNTPGVNSGNNRGSLGGHRSNNTRTTSIPRNTSINNNSFGGSRSSGGGSFGGGRSSGGSSGGGRSVGGGHSYGGRR
ncbi:MAG: hypothetical protein IKZ62_11410 [Prevotella sp.]|nr:hypothetical protein [Prevotella sp.]